LPACLYCGESDRPFTSEEHVIPESLGNKGHGGQPPVVLPAGVVCDGCNHGRLSRLDETLIKHAPIALMRTLKGVTSKSGKLPEAKFGNATLRMVERGRVRRVLFDTPSRKAFVDDGQGRIDLRLIDNRPMSPQYCRTLTRALYKMTLGFIYIDMPEVAVSELFDPVRRMILGLEEFHGHLVTRNKWHPPLMTSSLASLHYEITETPEGQKNVLSVFEYMGFEMSADLLVPELERPEHFPLDVYTIDTF
jgi:HNH endonuclease